MRVLLVEDSETDAKLLARELRCAREPARSSPDGPREESSGVHILRVEDQASMRAALVQQPWDVVLCNWVLPRFDAVAALALVKEMQLDIPFIIVSGTVGEDRAVEAMRAGAHDYLLKDRLARLAPAVEREIREHEARVARRISEQRAEDELRSREARFRALIERSADAIAVTDALGTTVYMSPSVTRILGYEPSELVGKSALLYLNPQDAPGVARVRQSLLAHPNASQLLEFRALHRDGSCVWIEATETQRLNDPAVSGIVSNFRDITGRKDAEEALHRAEARLRQAQKMEAVGSLAPGLPMTSTTCSP